jgi:hypothetical protein
MIDSGDWEHAPKAQEIEDEGREVVKSGKVKSGKGG